MYLNQVLISIIIPVYNVESYLEEALLSVVSQTFDNYEIIVINDGSTDNSQLIIDKFMSKYKNIKLIRQKNKGQSAARNRGIQAAKGEYIYFLDSDDYIKENALEVMYSEVKNEKLDILLFSGTSFYEGDFKPVSKYNYDYIKSETDSKVKSGEEIFIDLVKNKEYSSSPCLFFFKRETLEKFEIEFAEGIIHEDNLFSFQLILASKKAKVIPDILFVRRIRPSSTMTSKNYINSVRGNTTVFMKIIESANHMRSTNQKLKEAIDIRLGIIYGSIVNKYIYIDKEDKKQFYKEMNTINEIVRQKNYFNRKDLWLFNKSELIYSFSRRIYDYIR